MNQRSVRWRPASPAQWSVLFAASFGLLNLSYVITSASSYDHPFAIIGYVLTVTVSLLFGVLWWRLVERAAEVTYLRGTLVGLLAGLMAYVTLSVLLLPFSILGIIGILVLWLTAIYTVPSAIIVGVVATAVRKRA